MYPNPGPHRDESAQSTLRSIHYSGRPRPPASCSRHERPLDTRYSFSASSRVELPTFLPLPPWPLLVACRDSDANTLCENQGHTALHSAPLPPAASVENDCPAC